MFVGLLDKSSIPRVEISRWKCLDIDMWVQTVRVCQVNRICFVPSAERRTKSDVSLSTFAAFGPNQSMISFAA